jgi:hypothetical protein
VGSSAARVVPCTAPVVPCAAPVDPVTTRVDPVTARDGRGRRHVDPVESSAKPFADNEWELENKPAADVVRKGYLAAAARAESAPARRVR